MYCKFVEMKIFHIASSTILTSGVSVFTAEMASAQAKLGHDVVVVCRWKTDYPLENGAKYKILHDINALDEKPDIVHIEAVLSLYMIRAMRWCRANDIPYVVSPHGGLMPRVFERGKIKKILFWYFLLRPQLKRAGAICCTSAEEVKACRKLGVGRSFLIVPLGVKLPIISCNKNHDRKRTLLFLGRIGEEKGLVNLLAAWGQIPHDGWMLKLAGPDWRGHLKILEDKIRNENIRDVVFTGNANEKMKDELYREASLFVLPSPMENFSLVVVEALSYGIPAIATKGTPWSELKARDCGWWIDVGVEPLAQALKDAMSLSDGDREIMGEHGRKLVEEKYTWDAVVKDMVKGYEAILK